MVTPVPTEDLLLSEKSRHGSRGGAGRPPSSMSRRRRGEYYRARPANLQTTKLNFSEQLEKSKRYYSTLNSTTPRFPKIQPPATDAVYYYDKFGPKKDVEAEVENSPLTYFELHSTRERPKTAPLPAFNRVYDTNVLHKADIGTSVEKSSIAYHNVRTTSRRFQRPQTTGEGQLGPGCHGVPDKPRSTYPETFFSDIPRFKPSKQVANDNVYDLEKTSKKSVANCTLESPQKYSVMRSRASRLEAGAGSKDRGLREALNDISGTYNVDTGPYKTIATEIETEGHPYAYIFNSNEPKIQDTAKNVDPSLRRALLKLDFYDTDTGNKQSIATSTLRSPHNVSTLQSQTQRDQHEKPRTTEEIGPGAYDQQKADNVIRCRTATLPLPKSERFDSRNDTKSLQRSTFDVNRENQQWLHKPAYISKTERQESDKGSGTDQVYNTDTGNKMTLVRSVEKSPRKYAAVGKQSKGIRLIDPRVHLTNDTKLIHSAVSGTGESAPTQGDYAEEEENKEPTKEHRAMSSMQSRVARFQDGGDVSLRDALNQMDYRAVEIGTVADDVKHSPRTFHPMQDSPRTRSRRRAGK